MTVPRQEKPGAITPWTELNQLLAPSERYEVSYPHWKGFLLAPTHTSQLAALFYHLKEKKLSFCLEGRRPEPNCLIIISSRGFSKLVLHDSSVEVEGGCSILRLHQFLFENKLETAFENSLFSSPRSTVADVLLEGRPTGICLRDETLQEMLLGTELVTFEGNQLKWGGCHRSSLSAPQWHQLLWGMQAIPGMIVKVFLKTYPIPSSRLKLGWTFSQHEELEEHIHIIKDFTSSWELLDSVRSGCPGEKGFVFAQISGLEEEMAHFSQLCPLYARAIHHGERLRLLNYLVGKKMNIYSHPMATNLEEGEYFWYHEWDKMGWRITSKTCAVEAEAEPSWKNRFWNE